MSERVVASYDIETAYPLEAAAAAMAGEQSTGPPAPRGAIVVMTPPPIRWFLVKAHRGGHAGDRGAGRARRPQGHVRLQHHR